MENGRKTVSMVFRSITFLLVILIIGVVSAASTPTTFDVQDPSGNFNVRFTFPNGEGINAEYGYKIDGIDQDFVKINIKDESSLRDWESMGSVDAEIEVTGVKGKEWRSYYRHDMLDSEFNGGTLKQLWDDTTTISRALWWKTNPTVESGKYYFIEADPASGTSTLAFILMPTKDEIDTEKDTLQLLYEPPFPYLAETERLSSPDDIKGGELRAILTDDNGKAISGEIVHFYIKKGSTLHGTIVEPRMGPTSQPWKDIHPFLEDADLFSYVGYATTDSEGIARLNYILRGLMRSDVLADRLMTNGGRVEGTVKAVVVEKETVKGNDSWEQVWKVQKSATVPVEFEYLAQVVDIWGKGVPDSPPAGQLQYVVSGPGQVRVHRSLITPIRGTDQSVSEGFELMPGDIINIDGDTGVEVAWVNGDRIRMIVPKYVGVKEDQPVQSVNMLLCSDAYQSNFYTDYEKLSKAFAGVVYEEGTKTLIDTGKSLVPGAEALSTGYSHIINIIERSDEDYGKIDLSKYSIVTKIRVRSKIIVDATGENTDIYVIEGNPDILTVKGDEVTLTEGQMVSISDDGTMSEVQPFDTESALNEFYETTSDTPAVNGLVFESRSKPAGSSIQIPLTLNGVNENVGNMDLTLNYDSSVLEATEVIKGGLTTDSLFDHNIIDGTIKISLADKQGFSGDGSIAYVKFDVVGAEGSSSDLEITAMTANRADNYETIDIETHDGLFNVISMEEGMGDSDGDGVYTALDALYALQMAVDKIPRDPVMDVNEDGSVTSLDARNILKITVGD
ncbi:cohesin domain-containing protein [Methanolobus sp. WCC4]|uniref:cohesin domain-containing protein n=1 Tax=Methanolobus sp. WCC4 TaxID=3125784 RepID=UPI0030F7DEB9